MKKYSWSYGLVLSLLLLLGSASPAAAGVARVPQAEATVDSVPIIIDQILKAVGLEARFVAVPSDAILSAAAVMIEGQRCIMYNPAFVRAVNAASRTRWAGVSILAHEIGHHLKGHTLSTDVRNPAVSYRNELEADEFSGFVLRRMGASADDALAALALLTTEEVSSTHPPRSARVAAVATGWNAGGKGEAPAGIADLGAEDQGVAADTATVPAGAMRWRLNPAAIAGKLTFDAAPAHVLYLTRNMNLVDDDPNGARVLGSLERTRSKRYPFRLVQNDGQGTLMITSKGIIVDGGGKRVGQLTL